MSALPCRSFVAFRASFWLKLLLILTGVGGSARGDQVVYETTPSALSDFDWPAWNSAQTSGGDGFVTRNSFQLGASSQITSVTWDGYDYYWDGHFSAPATTTAWKVTFEADNAGAPGATLASYTVPVGAVTRTLLFNAPMFGDVQALYRDSLTLPSGFTAMAGTTYWLSVVSIQPVELNAPMYAWWPATEPGQSHVTRNFPGQNYSETLARKRSFRLIGGPALPGISVKAGNNIIAANGSYAFGTPVNLGQQSSVEITVTNTGAVPLTGILATTIPLGGTEFRQGTPLPPATLAPGAAATFPLIFQPAGTGTRTATLRVVSNADPSPYLVQLTGTGQDISPPVIVPQASNLTVVHGAPNYLATINTWASNHGGASATDNSGAVSWTHNYTVTPPAGSSAPITFTASDASGNQSTTQALLIVLDVTPPVISPLAANLTLIDGAAGNVTAVTNWLAGHGGAGATDNSGSVSWSHNYTALPVPGTSGTVIFTASDGSGNQSTTTAQLILLDQTPPVITTAAAPLTVVCDDPDRLAMVNAWVTAHGTAAATDNSGSITWSNNYATLPVACGDIAVTFSAKDPSGNVATTIATLHVSDSTNPVITTPAASLTVESDGLGNVAQRTSWLASHGGAAATDNCGPLTWSHNFTTLANTLPQTVPVTFTARDACGNPATSSAPFIIQDTTPPQITTAARDYYGDCDEAAADIADFLATRSGAAATDIAGPITWSHNYNGTLPPCEGYVTVTFTATDTVGLTASTTCRLFLFPPGAVWTGPPNGTWPTAAAWRHQVPTAALDAYVDLFDFQNTTVVAPAGSALVKDLCVGAGDELTLGTGIGICTFNVKGQTIRNSGIIRIGPSLDQVGVSYLYISGATTLDGPGKIIFAGTGRNHLGRGNNSTADILTVGPQQELTTTSDTIAEYQHSTIHAGIVNNGTITANAGGLSLYQDAKLNRGLMRAINGGTLRVECALDNTSGTITAGAGSTVWLQDALSGGTVGGTGLLRMNSTAAMAGPMTMESGLKVSVEAATTGLTGTITNNGTVLLGTPAGTAFANLNVNGAVTLQGSGKVILRGAARRLIERGTASSADVLTLAAGQEITSSAGTVASVQNAGIKAGLINQGTVTADAGGLALVTNAKTNQGTFRALNGGSLVITGSILTNYNASTDTLSGGRYEVVSTGAVTTMDMQSAPIAVIASGTTVRLSGDGALLPQLSTLRTISGALSLENGKTLVTTGNMAIPGRLQFGLPAAQGTTRLNVTGNADFTGGTVDVSDLGMTSGSYVLATWTGSLTGVPSLGLRPPGMQLSLVVDAVARQLRLEAVVFPPVNISAFSIVPGVGPNAGMDVVTLSGLSYSGAGYVIESSSDLTNWTPVSPLLSHPSGTLSFQFTQPANFQRRYFRFQPQ